MSKKTKKFKNQAVCQKCTGLCCRYFALPIENPEDWDDFDDIRWYLTHENVTVFVEDGEWYLNIKNKCKHLNDKTYLCEIYEKRPKICRKYSDDDCDYSGDGYEYELHFMNDEQMEEYMKIKFGANVLDNLDPSKKKLNKKKKRKMEKRK